jgi:hypothetical protein
MISLRSLSGSKRPTLSELHCRAFGHKVLPRMPVLPSGCDRDSVRKDHIWVRCIRSSLHQKDVSKLDVVTKCFNLFYSESGAFLDADFQDTAPFILDIKENLQPREIQCLQTGPGLRVCRHECRKMFTSFLLIFLLLIRTPFAEMCAGCSFMIEKM